MIKSHNKTGLKYLCATSKEKYDLYGGSGVYWKRHLKKYGKDITTELLFETDSKDELREKGLYFSSLYDVVESDLWANLIPETGYEHKNKTYGWFGWYHSLTNEERKKRNENISKRVTERYMSIDKTELSKEITRRRLSLTDKQKKQRCDRIRKTYESGKHDSLFERYSKERLGGKNPAAQSITVDGVVYETIGLACEKLCVTRRWLSYRLDSEKFVNYKRNKHESY